MNTMKEYYDSYCNSSTTYWEVSDDWGSGTVLKAQGFKISLQKFNTLLPNFSHFLKLCSTFPKQRVWIPITVQEKFTTFRKTSNRLGRKISKTFMTRSKVKKICEEKRPGKRHWASERILKMWVLSIILMKFRTTFQFK